MRANRLLIPTAAVVVAAAGLAFNLVPLETGPAGNQDRSTGGDGGYEAGSIQHAFEVGAVLVGALAMREGKWQAALAVSFVLLWFGALDAGSALTAGWPGLALMAAAALERSGTKADRGAAVAHPPH